MMKRSALILGLAMIGCSGDALSADGDIDLSFGTDGVSRTGIDDAEGRMLLAVSPADGSLLTCGTRGRLSATIEDFFVSRFGPDGVPDPAFGQGGSATVDFDQQEDRCAGIAIQPDGKIVVAGSEHFPQAFGSGISRFVVARLDANGMPDPAFGEGSGKVRIEFAEGSSSAAALALQPDGKIVIAGRARVGSAASEVDFAVVRLLPDGTPDASFGLSGRATAGFGSGSSFDYANDVVIDLEGRIVVVGSANGRAGIARFMPDGQLDSGFDEDGVTDLGSSPAAAVLPVSVLLQRDGRIVFAGTNGHVALVRLDDDGAIDPGFGLAGVATIPFDLTVPANESANDLVLQSDGKLVMVGNARYGDSNELSAIAARLSPSGSADPTFGEGGKAIFTFGLSAIDSQLFTSAGLAAGRILAAGAAIVGDNELSYDGMVVRLDNDLLFADGFH
jgi:uncharacterized delta-60 repeat protein